MAYNLFFFPRFWEKELSSFTKKIAKKRYTSVAECVVDLALSRGHCAGAGRAWHRFNPKKHVLEAMRRLNYSPPPPWQCDLGHADHTQDQGSVCREWYRPRKRNGAVSLARSDSPEPQQAAPPNKQTPYLWPWSPRHNERRLRGRWCVYIDR